MGTDGGADSLPSSDSQSNTICDQHSTNMCIEHKWERMEGLTVFLLVTLNRIPLVTDAPQTCMCIEPQWGQTEVLTLNRIPFVTDSLATFV